jgi:hypothetical protein
VIFISVLDSLLQSATAEDGKELKMRAVVNRPVPEHPDCEGCARRKGDDGCADYKHCAKWREWFSYEWKNICETARRMKHGNL